MLSLKNITASADGKEILHDISLALRPGRIYAVMGPNGGGKSTLGRAIMGDAGLHLGVRSRILLDRQDITTLSADKRAALGVFLSAQSPLAIPGVSVRDILRTALAGSSRTALQVKEQIDATAAQLGIASELLDRGLNDGASGGERKKLEVLQMALLNPRYIVLDEIDTGVDVDALRTIARFLKKFVADTTTTLVIITHATRILRYLVPDETIVIANGRIAARGDAALARTIEQNGFDTVLAVRR